MVQIPSRKQQHSTHHSIYVLNLPWLKKAGNVALCATCYKFNPKNRCSCCQEAYYCSRKCLRIDFRKGHKKTCNWSPNALLKKMKSLGNAIVIQPGSVRQIVQPLCDSKTWQPTHTRLGLRYLTTIGDYELFSDRLINKAIDENIASMRMVPHKHPMYNDIVTKITDLPVFGPVLAKIHTSSGRKIATDICCICLESISKRRVHT